MTGSTPLRRGKVWPPRGLRRLLAALVPIGAFVGITAAQDAPQSISGLPASVQIIPPKPPADFERAKSLVTRLSTNDAAIEVIAGQTRILTTTENLTVPGKPQGVISVGDNTVVDINIINSKTVRLVGLRMGVTDFTLVTPDDKVYAFEVHVVPDLDTLRAQLKALFPNVSLKLGLIRENVTVEGDVPSSAEARKIIETIEAYLASATIGQQRSTEAETRPTDKKGGPRPDKPATKPEEKAKPEEAKEPKDAAAPVGAEDRTSRASATVPQPKVINLLRVTPEIELIQRRLASLFPDTSVRVSQAGSQVVLEGQARDAGQVVRILEAVNAHLRGDQPSVSRNSATNLGGAISTVSSETVNPPTAQVVNLIRVPTSQQVLLKVRVAELNRTAAREIGADFLAFDTSSGTVVGTSLGNTNVQASGSFSGVGFNAFATSNSIPGRTTLFGIFSKGNFEVFFNALRRNSVLKILAEPNLVALNGQRASFLAGGEFFVPTVQGTALGGGGSIGAQKEKFGVSVDFTAHILDDDVIRLTVSPEVSALDFGIATTLVPGGSPVPGKSTRNAHTTVELRQGQTLAIAGLLQLTMDGTTTRIPGLGDLPILGQFFSNTTGGRTEKELVVLVTPYLVEPMNPDQVPCGPGDEVKGPTDLEFYLLGRIEGRTGRDFRATTEYDDALHIVRRFLRLHDARVLGPHGFCE